MRQPLIHVRPDSRVYIKGYRLHHGLMGTAWLIWSVAGVILSLSLIADDWDDRPWRPCREVFL